MGRAELDLEIRDCRRDDLRDVYEVEKMSFPHPYDFDVFQAYLLRVEHAGFDGFLVASIGAEIVGYMIFEYGRKGLIVSMAVRTDSQRRRVGTKLLAEAFRRLSKKCDSVTLQVGVTNAGAQQLYKKFGFSTIRILPNYYPDGEDAFMMEASGLQHYASQ